MDSMNLHILGKTEGKAGDSDLLVFISSKFLPVTLFPTAILLEGLLPNLHITLCLYDSAA